MSIDFAEAYDKIFMILSKGVGHKVRLQDKAIPTEFIQLEIVEKNERFQVVATPSLYFFSKLDAFDSASEALNKSQLSEFLLDFFGMIPLDTIDVVYFTFPSNQGA